MDGWFQIQPERGKIIRARRGGPEYEIRLIEKGRFLTPHVPFTHDDRIALIWGRPYEWMGSGVSVQLESDLMGVQVFLNCKPWAFVSGNAWDGLIDAVEV